MENSEVVSMMQGLRTEREQMKTIESLNEKGFKCDDHIQETLKLQLEAMGNFAGNLNLNAETFEARFLPQTENGVVGISAEDDLVPGEVEQAIEFTQNKWGLVLVVREPAIKYLKEGGTIGGGTLSALAIAAGFVPAAGPALAAICGLLAIALSSYLSVISLTDKGKGVYLTESWGQLAAAAIWPMFAPIILIPVVGPIE